MKIRTIISALFLIIITILYFFGFCEWDIWVYLFGVLATIIYMLIFIKQQKKYTKLLDQKEKMESNVINK
ncbi:hypothetical protein [Anaerorhabdus sp.]|uniref:hypothetical protein n=1 Tax=Anaerorhabdus sp. TaxID=1872524 RepID=UPI002FCA588F